MDFPDLEHITIDPRVMGGKPCIRGIWVRVGAVTGLLASGESIDSVLDFIPAWSGRISTRPWPMQLGGRKKMTCRSKRDEHSARYECADGLGSVLARSRPRGDPLESNRSDSCAG